MLSILAGSRSKRKNKHGNKYYGEFCIIAKFSKRTLLGLLPSTSAEHFEISLLNLIVEFRNALRTAP